ncbi:MAG: hypothetical protein KDD03_05015 [Gelidibacter sp.]|nr:hypothetical protein [Gelidibacter sp.]
MNKPTIILLLILTFFCCEKRIERIDIANQLRGNTFNMTSDSDNDTLTIEFKDSTFNVYEYGDRNLNWRVATFDNNNFLVFDRRIMAIKQNNKNGFDGLLIAEKDYKIHLEKRNAKWEKELLYGTWIEEKYIGTDSTDFPPPPIENIKSNWPPSYTITQNKILFDFYQKTESEIEVNNSGEYVTMDLKNPIFYGTTENLWQIKFVSDSLMIVDKQITEFQHSSQQEKELGGIRLIKKR